MGVRVMEFGGRKKVVSFGTDADDRLRRKYELINIMIDTGRSKGYGSPWESYEKIFDGMLDDMIEVYNLADSEETFSKCMIRQKSQDDYFPLIPATKKNYEKLIDCFFDIHPEIDHRPETGMRTPAKIALFAIGAPLAFLAGCMMGASAHSSKEREEKEEEERINKLVEKTLADAEAKRKRGY